MLSSKQKDIKIRNRFYKYENLNKITKLLFIYLSSRKNLKTNLKIKSTNLQKLHSKIRFFSKIKIRARCALTNRIGGLYRPYFISRIVMRELIQFGILPGYTKSVW